MRGCGSASGGGGGIYRVRMLGRPARRGRYGRCSILNPRVFESPLREGVIGGGDVKRGWENVVADEGGRW